MKTRHADRDLAAYLDKELGRFGTVLHSVALAPRTGRVDHVVIVPSGIWLIDSMVLSGRIERRIVKSSCEPESRLFLDGRDRTDLVDGLGVLRQARGVIRTMGLGDVPVHRAVCVIDAVWPMMGKPFQVGDVWITWPRGLTDRIRSSNVISAERLRPIAQRLTDRVLAET